MTLIQLIAYWLVYLAYHSQMANEQDINRVKSIKDSLNNTISKNDHFLRGLISKHLLRTLFTSFKFFN